MTTPKPKKEEVKKAPRAPRKKVEKTDDTIAEMNAEETVEASVSKAAKGGSFIGAVGRRKTSIARVRLIKNGKGVITVNGRPMTDYFTVYELREIVQAPLKACGQADALDVSAKVVGGGIRGQAEAVRHGLSRALVELNPIFRAALKKVGYLTRDSRKRERKKFGLKSARRAPQWSKR